MGKVTYFGRRRLSSNEVFSQRFFVGQKIKQLFSGATSLTSPISSSGSMFCSDGETFK